MVRYQPSLRPRSQPCATTSAKLAPQKGNGHSLVTFARVRFVNDGRYLNNVAWYLPVKLPYSIFRVDYTYRNEHGRFHSLFLNNVDYVR